MRLKLYHVPTLAVLFVCAACPILAQTVPSASIHDVPLAIGAGFSGFNPDDGHGHILGGTLWIDYTFPRMPHYLNGIGLEAEGRDLNYGRSATLVPALRQDIAAGGVIYSWPRYRNFRPYGKFLMGYGNADEEDTKITPPGFWTDSRTITCMGGGLELRAYRAIWLRADYEYQIWPDFYKHPAYGIPPVAAPAGLLNPQGFTVGAMYHFNHPHHH